MTFRFRVDTFFSLLLILFLSACGASSQNLSIAYTGQDPFANTAVSDVVYCAQNLPIGGQGLDENNDTIPDLFLYPVGCGLAATCASMKTPACGYDVSSAGQVTLGDLPTGFQYELQAEFRDASGNVLYCGSQTFNNDIGSPDLSINLASGNCP